MACGKIKSLGEFYYQRSSKTNYHFSRCKECIKQSYSPNHEKHREKRLKGNYGLSIADYETMLEAQNGVCAICKQPETVMMFGKVLSLAVDHSHVTGQVRGLLCSSCNKALGSLKDDIGRAKALVTYLEQFT